MAADDVACRIGTLFMTAILLRVLNFDLEVLGIPTRG